MSRAAALLTFVSYCQSEAAALGLRFQAYLLDVARLSLAEEMDLSPAAMDLRQRSFSEEPEGEEMRSDHTLKTGITAKS